MLIFTIYTLYERKKMRVIFFISLFSLFARDFNLFGMNDGEIKSYSVAIKIPNSLYADQSINPIHMSITYLGHADEKKLEEAKNILAAINTLRPILIKLGTLDNFGTKENPTPVIHVSIENPKIEELFIRMHKQLGVCWPSQTEKSEIPIWHVTVQDSELQEEFLNHEGPLVGGKLYIKPLGPFGLTAAFE